MFVWFKSRLNPWYISIPSNPNLYSTKIIMKMRWQTIASSVSMRTISSTATPLPTAYDCVAVYIAGRRTNLVVYGCWPKPTTNKKKHFCEIHTHEFNINKVYTWSIMQSRDLMGLMYYSSKSWSESVNIYLSTKVNKQKCYGVTIYFIDHDLVHLAFFSFYNAPVELLLCSNMCLHFQTLKLL